MVLPKWLKPPPNPLPLFCVIKKLPFMFRVAYQPQLQLPLPDVPMLSSVSYMADITTPPHPNPPFIEPALLPAEVRAVRTVVPTNRLAREI